MEKDRPADLFFYFLQRVPQLPETMHKKRRQTAACAPACCDAGRFRWRGWLQKKWAIPYVVTEHWTGYEKDSQDNYFQKNFFFRITTKRVLKNASLLLPVSKHLGDAIVQHIQAVPIAVVHNVADTSLFYYTGYQPPVFRFIHVSSMNYQKNIPGPAAWFTKAF